MVVVRVLLEPRTEEEEFVYLCMAYDSVLLPLFFLVASGGGGGAAWTSCDGGGVGRDSDGWREAARGM